jgi:hypothetical protein
MATGWDAKPSGVLKNLEEPEGKRERTSNQAAVWPGDVRMTINWLDLGIGAGLGTALGILGTWQIGTRLRKWSERRALNREYCSLGGHYVNHRVRDDGTHEPTGGRVELTWEPGNCRFDATGFQANGHPEWHSYINMSMQYLGAGTGHYNYSDSIHGGLQQVIYSKQARAFNVLGTGNSRKEFAHYWKLKD